MGGVGKGKDKKQDNADRINLSMIVGAPPQGDAQIDYLWLTIRALTEKRGPGATGAWVGGSRAICKTKHRTGGGEDRVGVRV